MTSTRQASRPTTSWIVYAVGIVVGVTVTWATNDVILGVGAGSALIAVTIGLIRLWTGSGPSRPRHP